MDEHTLKPIRPRPITTPISFVSLWSERVNTWFLYAEAKFRQYGVTCSQIEPLAVIHALLRDLTTCASMPMFGVEVSDAY